MRVYAGLNFDTLAAWPVGDIEWWWHRAYRVELAAKIDRLNSMPPPTTKKAAKSMESQARKLNSLAKKLGCFRTCWANRGAV